MAFSLYDATIPTYRQILGAVSGLLGKAVAHCAAHNIPEAELIAARLHTDMLPFSYQVKSTVAHSVGAIEGVRAGVFSPDLTPPPESFAALKHTIGAALGALETFKPAEINGFEGRDMRFTFKDYKLDFTAEGFLMSFSLPNFYFHAATAYDILRHKGVALGKRDFMGRMQIKG